MTEAPIRTTGSKVRMSGNSTHGSLNYSDYNFGNSGGNRILTKHFFADSGRPFPKQEPLSETDRLTAQERTDRIRPDARYSGKARLILERNCLRQ